MKTKMILMATLLLATTLSCRKEFLAKKPSTDIVVPKTLPELRALLENHSVMNVNGALGQISSDDCLVSSDAEYLAITDVVARNAYIWKKDVYEGQGNLQDWNAPYKAVFYANNVLAELERNNYSNETEKKHLQGSALFFRAYAFYDLATTFCASYSANATTQLGIPLRTSAGIDEILPRASLAATYQKILEDIQAAIPLLPAKANPAAPNMPSRPAAYGLLARIYLSMGNYQQAEAAADDCLQLYNRLSDFNTLNPNTISPFGYTNTESIFFASQVGAYHQLTGTSSLVRPYTIHPELLQLYHANDLRLAIFFVRNANGTYNGKRRYTLSTFPYTGIAMGEIYLIKAECLARRNEVSAAMQWIDQLLITRYRTGTYMPMLAANKEDALQKIWTERRKELVLRGSRWSDLKRLNREGQGINLSRTLNGTVYSLPAGDARYVFALPVEEIEVSGLVQNDR